MNIFPKPTACEETQENFVFLENENVYLIIDNDVDNEDFIRLSKELWKNYTANKSNLEVIKRKGIGNVAAIVKEKDFIPQRATTDYEYRLACNEHGIDIVYSEKAGLNHAFSTVLQLIGAYSNKNKNFTIQGCKISDSPVLKFRGIHLCVFPETSLIFLKKAIRLCGILKYSHIILEFWGMYKFETLPQMSWSDAYTKEQIKELVSDGKAFGVEFIPMFNHFGHAGQSRFKAGKNVLIDNAPEYEEYFEPGGWTWNVKNADTIHLLKSVRTELIDLFGEGEYFHIGCDEVYMLDGIDDGDDAQQNREFVNFVNDVAEDLKKAGRKTIMWGDMFLNKSEFKFPYCSNACNRCYDSVNNLKRLDPEIIIADWQYNIGKDMDGSVEFFKKYRNPQTIVLAPWEGYGNVSAEANINGRCELSKENHMLGVLATTWNTIYKDNKNLIYSACQMWSEDDTYAAMRTWETYKCFGMQNLRKLLPSGGCREKSGWLVNELSHDCV